MQGNIVATAARVIGARPEPASAVKIDDGPALHGLAVLDAEFARLTGSAACQVLGAAREMARRRPARIASAPFRIRHRCPGACSIGQ